MRKQIEALVQSRPSAYRALAHRAGYTELDLPATRAPSWWVHLVLVYYKRLYCNKRKPQRCFLRQDQSLSQYMGTMCSPTAPTPGRSAAPLSKRPAIWEDG